MSRSGFGLVWFNGSLFLFVSISMMTQQFITIPFLATESLKLFLSSPHPHYKKRLFPPFGQPKFNQLKDKIESEIPSIGTEILHIIMYVPVHYK